MIKKLLVLFSVIVLICSVSSISSFANYYYYGAFYNADEDKYEVKECNEEGDYFFDDHFCKKADFVMKFFVIPNDDVIKHYENETNERKKTFKGRYTKERPWPYLFIGEYKYEPIVDGYQRHHISSRNALSYTDFDSNKAPSVLVTNNVHKCTGSYRNVYGANEYRKEERDLLTSGKNEEALRKGINDLFSAIHKAEGVTESQLEGISRTQIDKSIMDISYVKIKMLANGEEPSTILPEFNLSMELEPAEMNIAPGDEMQNDLEFSAIESTNGNTFLEDLSSILPYIN